jgi:hypothetical protein
MAINQTAERQARIAEVRQLETQWVQEEEIARIVDEELSFLADCSAG